MVINDAFELRRILLIFGFQQPGSTPIKILAFLALVLPLLIYQGFHPLTPEAVEFIIIYPMILGVISLITVMDFFGLGAAAIGLLMVAPFGIAAVERSLKTVLPSNDWVEYGAEAPIGIKVFASKYGSVTVAMTNLSDNFMARGNITCNLPSLRPERPDGKKSFGFGDANWRRRGESIEAAVISSNDRDTDAKNVTCRIDSAQFYLPPVSPPSFTFSKNQDSKYVFKVSNERGNKKLTKLSFSCMSHFGDRHSKNDPQVSLTKASDGAAWLNPGQIGYYVSDDSFAGRTISDCFVRDAMWE